MKAFHWKLRATCQNLFRNMWKAGVKNSISMFIWGARYPTLPIQASDIIIQVIGILHIFLNDGS